MNPRAAVSTLILLCLGLWGGAFGAQAAQERQLRALSMFESGNRDTARGKNGELSRFQIPPATWARYTSSRAYTNPAVAQAVAQKICAEREAQFRREAGRDPVDVELFLLWACPTKFRALHYQYNKISAGTRKQAERFAALAAK